MIFHIYQEDFGYGKQFLHLKFLCFDWWEAIDFAINSGVIGPSMNIFFDLVLFIFGLKLG